MSTNNLFIKGILFSTIVFILDQMHKWYMLEVVNIDQSSSVKITSFFNLVMVWNSGVSFGMGQSAEYAPLIFSIIAIIIVIALLWWLYFCTSLFLAAALGLVVGGAIGNVIDRLRFGAVADFFDFHAFGYHWPAFNIADSAVFIGAVMLCIDSIRTERK